MSANPRRFRRPLTLALVALFALAATPASAGKFDPVAAIGMPMPAFGKLPATDGSTLSATGLDTDVVVLVFLADHCPWVRGMDQDLVHLAGRFAGKSVRFVGVSINHREEDRLPAMKEHAARVGYPFTYVYDESQQLGRALGATHTPEYFVFGKDRKLAYMGAIHDSPAMMRRDGSVHYTNGPPQAMYVQEAVEALLAGRPVAVPETAAHGCSLEYETAGTH